MPDRHAGDREVLDRALGVNAPVGGVRDLGVAQQVVLEAGVDLSSSMVSMVATVRVS